MFDLLQTTEPDPVVEEIATTGAGDRVAHPRPRADVPERRAA